MSSPVSFAIRATSERFRTNPTSKSLKAAVQRNMILKYIFSMKDSWRNANRASVVRLRPLVTVLEVNLEQNLAGE